MLKKGSENKKKSSFNLVDEDIRYFYNWKLKIKTMFNWVWKLWMKVYSHIHYKLIETMDIVPRAIIMDEDNNYDNNCDIWWK